MPDTSNIFEALLLKRGLDTKKKRDEFLCPDYEKLSDPFALSDMNKAVSRLELAHKNGEKITIYGDYDVDGVTATALLLDAFSSFGFKNVTYLLPNRVNDGYGLNKNVVKRLKELGTDLLITVDCGSVNFEEVKSIRDAGIGIIITDHHETQDSLPEADAIINPKRRDSNEGTPELAGVGVAFYLVRALQEKLQTLPKGQEKWLLDLVAIGTICDMANMLGDNRVSTYFGLKVLSKTRRCGIKALASLADADLKKADSQMVGFRIGPRLNAAGRLGSAELALRLLIAAEKPDAASLASELNSLNSERKSIQNQSLNSVSDINESESVLVVRMDSCHEGVIGILASNLLEEYKKPVVVFTADKKEGYLKGSARSFGDFSLADALKYLRAFVVKGGGHNEAAGVTIKESDFDSFKSKINLYYNQLNLENQEDKLLANEDVIVSGIGLLNRNLFEDIKKLEPFGVGNPEPIFKLENVEIISSDKLGKNQQHLKLAIRDADGNTMKVMGFSSPETWLNLKSGNRVDIWISLSLNTWNGYESIEGRIRRINLL